MARCLQLSVLELLPARLRNLDSSAYLSDIPLSQSVLHDVKNPPRFWSKQQKRVYGRIRSGLKYFFVRRRFRHLKFMCLTSSKDAIRPIGRSWKVFVMRMRRRFKQFEYCRLTTTEGQPMGVIHAIVYMPYLAQGELSKIWFEIHKSSVVWITRCYGRFRDLIRYCVNQYVIGRHGESKLLRMSYSSGWLFRGFVKKMKFFISQYGFQDGIFMWNSFIVQYALGKVRKSFKQVKLFSV